MFLRRFSRMLAAAVVLTSVMHASALAHPITSNDLNSDGYVDRLHIKPDGIELWNQRYDAGYRVVGMTIASLDPHWNSKVWGIEAIRVLPDRESAKNAMRALGYPYLPTDWNPVWPETLFSSFFLLDNNTSAAIDQVTPTSSGTTSLAWARALLQLLSVGATGNPYARVLATYFINNYVDWPGGSGISNMNGGVRNYAWNNSRFLSRDDWMYAPNMSLPPSVSARDAHQQSYQDVGIVHEYQYSERDWAHGSQHPIQAAASVMYCYETGYTYCYRTPTVYQGYSAQGY